MTIRQRHQGLKAALRAADKLIEVGHQVDEITLGRYKQFLCDEFQLSDQLRDNEET